MNTPPTERLRQAVQEELDSYKAIGHPIAPSEAALSVKWRWIGSPITAWSLTPEELAWLDLVPLPCSCCGEQTACTPDALTSRRYSRRCTPCDRAIRRANARRHSADYRQARRVEKQPQPCSHCGELFTPQRSTARFCSTKCRVASARAARPAWPFNIDR